MASSVATRVAVARTAAPFVPHCNGAWRGGKRAGSIPERSSGWRPGRLSLLSAGRSDRTFLLCRPSPPPPYRASRPNICRFGSRGKPRAANDVAHIKSAADVEQVLSDEVGHIDRVIARGGRDPHRELRQRGGAVVRRRPDLPSRAREHPLEQKHESIDRYHRGCRALLSGPSDAGNRNGFSSTVLATDSDVGIDTGDFETTLVAARAADDSPFCAPQRNRPIARGIPSGKAT